LRTDETRHEGASDEKGAVMPVIQGSVSIAANAVNDNVLQGSQWEFMPYNGKVDFGFTGSAAGILLDVFSGTDMLGEAFAPPATNRTPINPDDFTLTDVAAAGERLKVRARNTTGGALTIFWSIIITPLL
jgi:hypothetical protein